MLHTLVSTLAGLPPVAVAILIGIGYVYFAGGHWAWSMLPDVGLLALYLWRPSWGMLSFVLLLGSVRHIPAWARELASMFRLDEYEGWTHAVVVFLLPALITREHMSSAAQGAPKIPGMDAVYRPVEQTGMDTPDQPAERDITSGWDMPPVTPFLTDDEFVVFLATQKDRAGKHRLSANKIVAAAGGDRNHVLALVRQVREGPVSAVYRPLTEAQQQTREDLGLPTNGGAR